MTLRQILLFLSLLFELQAPLVSACGFCIEDKIAFVYDHALVIGALEEGHQVVFCSINASAAQSAVSIQAIKPTFESLGSCDSNRS